MTIRTVTMSPGFDHVVRVDRIEPGGVARVLDWTTYASGKGLNVSRTATVLGAPCVSYSLVGEADQAEFVRLVEATGSGAVTVQVPGETRKNLTLEIDTSAGPASHAVGERSKGATDTHAEALMAQLLGQVEPGDVVTFNGATPSRIRAEIWADAAQGVCDQGATLVADVQGESLAALLATGLVTMAKPNEEEITALLGVNVGGDTRAAHSAAINAMLDLGVTDPIVSIGRDGVVHVVNGTLTRSWCPVDEPKIVVGAGDAFVAGYCAALECEAWSDVSLIDLALAVASVHVSGVSEGSVPAVRDALTLLQHEVFA